MTRRILITGGLGYIGGRIAVDLASRGYNIRLSTRRESASWPEWSRPLEVKQIEPFSISALDDLCQGVDAIIHLAAMNENDCIKDPIGAVNTNCAHTVQLLAAARRASIKRFIYFSTIHVYGSPLAGLISEKDIPRPTHPYAITHRAAEDFVLAAHDRKEITGLVLRLSNGMGAPMDSSVNRWTLVFNDLCRQAVTQKKLVLQSSGVQVRDFMPLSEVCRATAHFLALPTEKIEDGIFNLGSGRSLSILTAATLVAERCQQVLKFSPPIERPDTPQENNSPDLTYRMDKLAATGFSIREITPLLHKEIDATLRLCHASFS